MKIQVLRTVLEKALASVARFTASGSALPVLQNILLATEGGRLKLAANNLEAGITVWISAQVEQGGAITVPAITLVDIVRNLGGERIELSANLKTQTLALQADKSRANIKGIAAEEFPAPNIDTRGAEGTATISAHALQRALARVVLAAAKDESRPLLKGVQMCFLDDRLDLAAADGFRVSVCSLNLAEPVAKNFAGVVPAPVVAELVRILSGAPEGEQVIISSCNTGNQLTFEANGSDLVLTSQLIDGQFPDVRALVPNKHATRISVPTHLWLQAVKAARIFAKDNSGITRLKAVPNNGAPGSLTVSAQSAESGDGVTTLEADVEGAEVEIAFNVAYLAEALGVMTATAVNSRTVLLLTKPNAPGMLRPGDEGSEDTGFSHVIMPMHFQTAVARSAPESAK